MFRITDNKGFQLTFPNGWTVSVQFGRGNYCQNDGANGDPSLDAEIAAWDANGDYYAFDRNLIERGWQSTTQVLEFMNLIASKPQSVSTKPRSEFVRLDGE